MKSNPKIIRMLDSRSISFCLVTNFFSSSPRRLIILVKLGEIGCSNLAAIKILIVDKATIYAFGKLDAPTELMYLSNMDVATNSVSFLYSFLVCKSNIF